MINNMVSSTLWRRCLVLVFILHQTRELNVQTITGNLFDTTLGLL